MDFYLLKIFDSLDLIFVQEHWLHSDHLMYLVLISSLSVLVVWIVALFYVGGLLVVVPSCIANASLTVLHL